MDCSSICDKEFVPEHLWRVRKGDQFGNLVVLSDPYYAREKNAARGGWQRKQTVVVQCKCGKTKEHFCTKLTRGVVTKCQTCGFKVIAEKNRTGSLAEDGKKKCSRCLEQMNVSSFSKDGRTQDGLRSYCSGCAREMIILCKYGMSAVDYLRMVDNQKNKCASCGDGFEVAKLGKDNVWSIDHNHQTGRVRALLCRPCNTNIGMADEDPKRLRAQAEYLERHKNLVT